MSTLFYRSLFAVLLLANLSVVQAGVVLERIRYSGEVLPGHEFNTQCTFTDTGKLVIQYQLSNGLTSKRIVPIQLSNAAIKTAIDEAALGTIASQRIGVDGNTQIFYAYQNQTSGAPKQILLYEENGGDGIENKNNSLAAKSLRNFIDVNCGSF